MYAMAASSVGATALDFYSLCCERHGDLAPPYSSAAIANRFLSIADRKGALLDPMKIQKLVYIAHGWHLALAGQPLCSETVHAWRWGPVFPDLYHAVKQWGRDAILEPVFSGEWRDAMPVPDDGSFASQLLDAVWENYSRFTGPQLSRLTHMEGTPWDQIHSKGGWYEVIPNDLIAEHYREKAAA